MKKLILILFLFIIGSSAIAQTDSEKTSLPDTVAKLPPLPAPKPIKKRPPKDSLGIRQITDSIKRADSLAKADSAIIHVTDSSLLKKPDTVALIAKPVIIKRPYDSVDAKLANNPFLKKTGPPIYFIVNEHARRSKDEMFYLLSGLLLFLAFVRLVFSRYFQNIFRLFFQPSFRQKQTREQLLQSNLPSLLLNLFFVFSGGAYISFLLEYYHIVTLDFWAILLYSSLALLVLYLGKFIFLSFAGWVFNVKEATDTYIFTVYLINKIIGVLLVPFTLIIAFSQTTIINISITVSLLLLLVLFIYRYFASYNPVRREVKVSVLHFFLYICAFEIIPLLLIYKTLIIYMDKSL